MADDDESLLGWLLPTRRESESDRDGFLSTTAEVHTFVNGLFRGLYSPDPRPWRHGEDAPTPDGDENVQEEVERAGIWYWRSGYILGDLMQIAVFVMLLRWGLSL